MIRYLVSLTACTVLLLGLLFGMRTCVANNAAGPDLTDERRLHSYSIGEDRLAVPANMIRNPAQRQVASGSRLDLWIHWPSGLGYTADLDHAFRQSAHQLVAVTVRKREMPLGMNERLASVYAEFFAAEPYSGSGGLVFQRLDDESGYKGEALAIAARNGMPWVARCPVAETGSGSGSSGGAVQPNAMCLHDFHTGQNLSVVYRFDTRYLPQWEALDRMVRQQVGEMLRD